MVKEFPLTLGEHFRALCEFTLPVSGPWFFAVCGLPHILLLLTFPAVVLVFGELSPGTGMGVTGPCPEEGWVLPSLAGRAGSLGASTFLSFWM